MSNSTASNIISFETLEPLIEEMRDLIDGIHNPRPDDYAWMEKIKQSGEELAAKLANFAHTTRENYPTTYRAINKLYENLQSLLRDLSQQPNYQVIIEHRNLLAQAYEKLLVELKREGAADLPAALVQTQQLKPFNYARNINHTVLALIGVLLYYFYLTHQQAVAVLGTLFIIFVILEMTRRFSKRLNDFWVDKVFRAIVRPSERYRINSATIFLTALLIIVWIFPKTAAITATLVLGFSDPAATIVGKRWGRRRIWADKTLIGSLAFFVVGFIVVGTFLILTEPGYGLWRISGIAAGMAGAGTITELFSGRIDDNFSVPIVCAIVGTLLIG